MGSQIQSPAISIPVFGDTEMDLRAPWHELEKKQRTGARRPLRKAVYCLYCLAVYPGHFLLFILLHCRGVQRGNLMYICSNGRPSHTIQ